MTERLTALPWDWYPGVIPDNVHIDATAYVETSFSFTLCRSQLPESIRIGRGASAYLGTMFDLGPGAAVEIGEYSLVNGARVICDRQVTIGGYCLISWNVVIMDTYRLPFGAAARRRTLDAQTRGADAAAWPGDHSSTAAVHIGSNVWIGFDVCILPGVTIGDGAIVGARSVVTADVPPYAIAAGNPARVIRSLPHSQDAPP